MDSSLHVCAARFATCLLMVSCCISLPAQAADAEHLPETIPASTLVIRNDLDGPVQGQVDFAQTHVIAAQRRIFDPLLVPGREALIIFTPTASVQSAIMVVHTIQGEKSFPMAPPAQFPKTATFDKENVFSGNPIVGSYPVYKPGAFTATVPASFFQPENKISFFVNNDTSRSGTLGVDKMVFLKSESEGFVSMNIKGCILKPEKDCNVQLDQFDMQKNPELAKIAAREMFSELPVKELILGMGQTYWPYLIAMGPDGMPHRYQIGGADYREWAAYGDKTLPAKVGMGNFWRAASDLGNKAPGKFVAITGQLLDVPNDILVFPPEIGASCGGNSCNYPNRPVGFWHETAHGLGLSHVSPPRYEDWAYRSYDQRMLPNYHPNPHAYGLEVDYLGYHYFGNVVGLIEGGAWPADATASAPLIDDFEALKAAKPSDVLDWKRYIAPFTHQQMLIIQRRFGSFPSGLKYAAFDDDHRPPRTSAQTSEHVATMSTIKSDPPLDDGIDLQPHDQLPMLKLLSPNEHPILVGVPVQTLVVTMASADNDAQKISQIYPPIVSNYGNVFAPTNTQPSDIKIGTAAFYEKIQIGQTGKCLTLLTGSTVGQATCILPDLREQLWVRLDVGLPVPLFRLMNVALSKCLASDLSMTDCDDINGTNIQWNPREDLTLSTQRIRLQTEVNGKFISAAANDSLKMDGIGGDEQLFYPGSGGIPVNNFKLRVHYLGGAVDNFGLSPGILLKTQLASASINVASDRKPLLAELFRNNQIVDSRNLDGQPVLPPPLFEGIPDLYESAAISYIRDTGENHCLMLNNGQLQHADCQALSPNMQWKVVNQPALPDEKSLAPIMTLAIGHGCLDSALTVKECDPSDARQRWRGRLDITADPNIYRLQDSSTGRFVTVEYPGSKVSLEPQASRGQTFKLADASNIGQPYILRSMTNEKCLTRLREKITTQDCNGDLNQLWKMPPSETVGSIGPYFSLMDSYAERCVNADLDFVSCVQNAPEQRWAGRLDMTNDSGIRMLQNSTKGLFVTTGPDGDISMKPLTSGPDQRFRAYSHSQSTGKIGLPDDSQLAVPLPTK